MSYPEEQQLQSLFQVAKQREQKARRRAILYSLIPIALAAMLLTVSFWTIREAENRVKNAEQKIVGLQKQIDDLTTLLNEKAESLSRTTDFERHAFRGDIYMVKKLLWGSFLYEKQTDMLDDILEMQKKRTRWKRGGTSPREGFDSPGFAAYMLNKHKLIRERPSEAHYRLQKLLPDTVNPSLGDIVFYSGGYTMFYFEDEQKRPFVIGMTPEGIFALDHDFAVAQRYGEVRY